mmetsp:Transcript_18567/g.37811  ORF Transcript_18567/g.37811 Transcript_18567/m.37811 type:complete len:275 (-) Transcript_18567:19-843(-)
MVDHRPSPLLRIPQLQAPSGHHGRRRTRDFTHHRTGHEHGAERRRRPRHVARQAQRRSHHGAASLQRRESEGRQRLDMAVFLRVPFGLVPALRRRRFTARERPAGSGLPFPLLGGSDVAHRQGRQALVGVQRTCQVRAHPCSPEEDRGGAAAALRASGRFGAAWSVRWDDMDLAGGAVGRSRGVVCKDVREAMKAPVSYRERSITDCCSVKGARALKPRQVCLPDGRRRSVLLRAASIEEDGGHIPIFLGPVQPFPPTSWWWPAAFRLLYFQCN